MAEEGGGWGVVGVVEADVAKTCCSTVRWEVEPG